MKRTPQFEEVSDASSKARKRARNRNINPITEIIETNQDLSMSDSESSESVIENDMFHLNVTDLVRVDEGDRLHSLIKSKFLSSSERNKSQIEVVAIHRNSFSSLNAKARLQSFRFFSRAVEMKMGGNHNTSSYAWYAAPKYSISQIISHGFCCLQENTNGGLYGCGIYLSPDRYAIQSVDNMAEDEDGLKHIFLCRVILGNSEVVHPGSVQCHPSSEDIDSGVDDLMFPTKYIIWSTNKNTHILPQYLLTLRKSSPPEDTVNTEMAVTKSSPTSPWIPLTQLNCALSAFLPKHSMELIEKYGKDHHEKKISRADLVKRLRMIAGDHLLASIIKVFTFKCRRPEEWEKMNTDMHK